jgi:hypothetical protein
MFERIVVTADLLRPYSRGLEWESATWKNVRWLREILKPALSKQGHDPVAIAWDPRIVGIKDRYFDTPALYDRLGLEISLENWAQLSWSTCAPTALVEALEPSLSGSLVIGYELPPVMLDALRQLELPYIDIVLHPWRFLPDLVFALRSNVPEWEQFFSENRIPRSLGEQQAAFIHAKAAWMPVPIEMPPGTALVLGQVATDRAAALSDGRFASLHDHLYRLHQLCVEHPLVLYKPHPYVGDSDPSMKAIERLPSIRVINHNFYHLLTQPELTKVVALNSSGLSEALIFGRQAENLIPFLYQFDDDRPGSLIGVDSRWTQPWFWQGLLRGKVDPASIEAPFVGQSLRRSMNADWGYGFIERVCV